MSAERNNPRSVHSPQLADHQSIDGRRDRWHAAPWTVKRIARRFGVTEAQARVIAAELYRR